MSLQKITAENKEDIREVNLPRKNTLTAEDFNEIKTVVNAIADRFVFVTGEGVVPEFDGNGQIGINTTDARLFIQTESGIKYVQLIDLP